MESKTYVFNPESGTSGTSGSGGILAMLPALMQKQGVDPGLIALLNNRDNGNGWGNDIFAILLLFILMGNGNWGGFGGNRCYGGNGQGGVVPFVMLKKHNLIFFSFLFLHHCNKGIIFASIKVIYDKHIIQI